MLPDFPDVKDRNRRLFLEAVRKRILAQEPLLAGIGHRRVHEGRTARLTRRDRSVDEMEFQEARAELQIPREQMRSVTIEQLLAHVNIMAEQFAEQQVHLMISKIHEAVENVGNSVSAQELGNMEAYLESQRRIEVEFDPDTLQPKDMVIVLHPDRVDSFVAQMKQWEEDPYFREESEKIRAKQLEAWRAREDSRRLVD